MKSTIPFFVESIRAMHRERAEASARGEPSPFNWRYFVERIEAEIMRPYYEHAVLSPSGIGGISEFERKCTRQLVYKILRADRDAVGSRSQVAFDLGVMLEAYVLACLDHTIWRIEGEQKKIEIAEGVFGYIDAIAKVPESFGIDHIGYLIDVKSISDRGFKNMLGASHGTEEDYQARLVRHRDGRISWENERTGPKPIESHFIQQELYLHGLAKTNPEIDSASLIYINKNTGALAEFWFPYDREIAEAALKRIEEVEEIAAHASIMSNGWMPERERQIGEDWECDYCVYRSGCERGLPEPIPASEVIIYPREVLEACQAATEAIEQTASIKAAEEDRRKAVRIALQNAGIQEKFDARKIKRMARQLPSKNEGEESWG